MLVVRYEWYDHTLIIVQNFTAKPRAVVLDAGAVAAGTRARHLVDLLATNDSRADENGRHVIQLQPYDYRSAARRRD